MTITIAIVEDVAATREHLLAVLGRARGLKCLRACASGEEALRTLPGDAPDVVLMDMVMPDMDGLALTRALRQLPAPWCHMPVVALTANTNPLDEQQALQAGMDMVLHKPINPKALVRTVSQALGAATPRGSA